MLEKHHLFCRAVHVHCVYRTLKKMNLVVLWTPDTTCIWNESISRHFMHNFKLELVKYVASAVEIPAST